MGKQSREKKERRELGEIRKKQGQEIRPVAVCKGLILVGTFLILFTPLIGPPLTNSFFFPFVGPKSLYFMGLAELIFFAWLFLILLDKRYRPKFGAVLLALFLFLAVSVGAALTGIDPSFSFWSKFERMSGILMLLHLFAFFLVISSTFKEEDWHKIFSVSIFVGTVAALIATFSKNEMTRGGGTLGNDSFLGTYLLFSAFFALYLLLRAKEQIKIYSSICLAFIFLILSFSGARAAKLSLWGGLFLLFILWLIFYKKEKFRLAGILLSVFSLIFTAFFAISAFQPESFVKKHIINKYLGETFGGRFVVWGEGWESFLNRPLLGWGPENYEFAFTKDYNPCMGTERCGADMWYDRAHNIIFDTLVASGALGMITYVLIFLFAFYFLWKNYFRKNLDFWLAGIFTVLLIAYFIQNLTVFDMVSSYMVFFLTLGFIARKEINQAETLTPNTKSFFIFPALLIFASLFFVSFFEFVIHPLKADAYTISALRTPTFSEQRLSYYKKTLSSSPVGKYQLREFFVDASVGSFSEKVSTTSAATEFDFLEKELEKSIQENPINYRAYLKLGQIFNTHARIEPSKLGEAEKILKKAIEFSPTNQQGYWYLAQTKIQQGDNKEAFSLAEKALELEPNLERSHIIVIRIAGFMGDQGLMEKKVKEALAINPGWEKDIKSMFGGS